MRLKAVEGAGEHDNGHEVRGKSRVPRIAASATDYGSWALLALLRAPWVGVLMHLLQVALFRQLSAEDPKVCDSSQRYQTLELLTAPSCANSYWQCYVVSSAVLAQDAFSAHKCLSAAGSLELCRCYHSGTVARHTPTLLAALLSALYLVDLCLAGQEDEHITRRLMLVDVHGSVHRCCQVVLCMVLLAVHYLHLKGAPWHAKDGAVIKVRAELLAIQRG